MVVDSIVGLTWAPRRFLCNLFLWAYQRTDKRTIGAIEKRLFTAAGPCRRLVWQASTLWPEIAKNHTHQNRRRSDFSRLLTPCTVVVIALVKPSGSYPYW